MQYHIARNGQTYGPYTLDDIRRYVGSGNILLTDMARGDDMAEWVAVSQLLWASPAAAGYAEPNPGIVSHGVYPDPPNLHWAVVLLIDVFTCSLFMFVWNLVLSSWMRRVKPTSRAFYYYIGAVVLALLAGVTGHSAQTHLQTGYLQSWRLIHTNPLGGFFSLASWVVRLIARFTMRADLEEHYNHAEPVGLRLSPVMTFFFGGLYFQYHLNRINEMKRIARYRGAAI